MRDLHQLKTNHRQTHSE